MFGGKHFAPDGVGRRYKPIGFHIDWVTYGIYSCCHSSTAKAEIGQWSAFNFS